jgi:sulfatase maturation enzyme AslB (radical SAM superfamily)
MQKIPKTFCPAKWDELHLNYNYNWAYGCCKATPIVFKRDWHEELDKQKNNLLQDVQDPSCDYCWQVENQGGVSDRQGYLDNFDYNTFELYQQPREPSTVEVNLGNECNFQCTYCGPQFSSKWQQEQSTNPIKFKTDIQHYRLVKKQDELIDNNLRFLNKYQELDTLNLIGGEPLLNKKLFKMLDEVDNVKNLHITTNFSCSHKVIDNIIERSQRYHSVKLAISLDSTGLVAEFTRWGMDYDKLISNIDYLIDNIRDNIEIRILTLVSALTIVDLDRLTEVVNELKQRHSKLTWRLSYCVSPRIQSFATVKDELKLQALDKIKQLALLDYTVNADTVVTSLEGSEFDSKLYKEQQEFLEEFSLRKKIAIPRELANA